MLLIDSVVRRIQRLLQILIASAKQGTYIMELSEQLRVAIQLCEVSVNDIVDGGLK